MGSMWCRRRSLVDEATVPSRPAPRATFYSLGRAFAIACVTLGAVVGCEEDAALEVLPTELVGTWRTQDPRYAVRFFEIKDDQILFQTGEGVIDFTVHSIRRATAVSDDIGLLYTFEYDVDGDEQTFGFDYDAPSGVLTFRNQPEMEWRREAQ
jgi:hypothetical protein